jgi:hypothetical protein
MAELFDWWSSTKRRSDAHHGPTSLARDGIIEARQGRGTFITGTLKQDRWLKVETTPAKVAGSSISRTAPYLSRFRARLAADASASNRLAAPQ